MPKVNVNIETLEGIIDIQRDAEEGHCLSWMTNFRGNCTVVVKRAHKLSIYYYDLDRKSSDIKCQIN